MREEKGKGKGRGKEEKSFEFIEQWKANFTLKGLFYVFLYISLYKNQMNGEKEWGIKY